MIIGAKNSWNFTKRLAVNGKYEIYSSSVGLPLFASSMDLTEYALNALENH